MTPEPLELAVDALAVFRLTRLATEDAITEGLRLKVKRAALGSDAPDSIAAKLETLLECPWCVSAHIAVGVVAARRYAPRLWDPLARVLAFSAAAGIVAEST